MNYTKIALIFLSMHGIISGSIAYISDIFGTTIFVFDTASNEVIKTIAIGDGPAQIAFTPDGKFAYVPLKNENVVKIIETSLHTVVGLPIPVGNSPEGIAITPDGKFAYVANRDSNSVSAIRLSDNMVIATIPVGIIPISVAITRDGKTAYVSNALSFDVTPIDVATNVAGTPIFLGGGVVPNGLAISPNGNILYTSNGNSDSVSVIKIKTNSVIDSFSVGADPFFFAFNAAGTAGFVTGQTAHNVTRFSTANQQPQLTINVGNFPEGIARAPLTDVLYVVNAGDSSLTPINAATNNTGDAIPIAGGNGLYFIAFIPEFAPTPLAPPTDGKVTVICNMFLNKTERLLLLSWNASVSPMVTTYKIYLNEVLIGTVPASQPLRFQTCVASNNAITSLSVTSVDINNQESVPLVFPI